MSAEVTRWALEQTRQTLLARLPGLLETQVDTLEAVVCLVDGGGNRLDVAWHRGSRPRDPATAVRLLVAQAEAKACVFAAEFQRDLAGAGTAAAMVAWSFPEEGAAESVFCVYEGQKLSLEVDEGLDEVGPSLVEWLQERLVGELSEKS